MKRFESASLRRPALVLAGASLHRNCASLPAQKLTPARPIVHATLADAHLHVSCLLAAMLHTRPPASLADYLAVTEAWWHDVEQLVLLPFPTEAIHDLTQYLAECTGVQRQRSARDRRTNAQREAAEDEAALLEEWEAWVWSSIPRTMPTAATFSESLDEECGGVAGPSSVSRQEVISYPQLTSLLYSYSRYHRGVQWGAASHRSCNNSRGSTKDEGNTDGAAAAAYYRRRYLLHPWHGLCCPDGTAQQMPYVHVLRWMLAGKEAKMSPEELWRQHRALEPFHVPRSTAGSSPSTFRALDVCSQSGFVTDLLLRAGADLVVAADADLHALGNTESTYHEHVREGRSKRRGQVLLTQRCDSLPMPKKRDDGDASKENDAMLRDGGAHGVDTTSASAAERRRRRAREQGRGYSGVRTGGTSGSGHDAAFVAGAPHRSADGSPFDVVYIHPPAPTTLWPVTAASPASATLRSTSWWRGLVRTATKDGVPPQLLLPFLPCASIPSAVQRSPFATLSGLRRIVDALRSDVTERRSRTDGEEQEEEWPSSAGVARRPVRRGGRDALLSGEGYVVLVLPRTYDVASLLEREALQCPSLADWVVAQLDGYYDLVLRRRCLSQSSSSTSFSSGSTPSAAPLDPFEAALVSYPRRLHDVTAEEEEREAAMEQVRNSSSSEGVSGTGSAFDSNPWRKQLTHLYEKEWWYDVLVLKKNPAMAQRCAAARHDAQPLLRQRPSLLRQAQGDVTWEDSFEYNEYHPRDTAAHTSHHWTDLLPTYSYLESDFYDSASAQSNFLAVGHQPSLLQARPATAAAVYGVPSFHDDGSGPLETAAVVRSGKDAGDGGVATASAKAVLNFHTLFAQELRTQRRSKLRKLALSPLERQEWYIDEKLIKSSGARVELMNELARWDLKDYDN